MQHSKYKCLYTVACTINLKQLDFASYLVKLKEIHNTKTCCANSVQDCVSFHNTYPSIYKTFMESQNIESCKWPSKLIYLIQMLLLTKCMMSSIFPDRWLSFLQDTQCLLRIFLDISIYIYIYIYIYISRCVAILIYF